MNPVYGNENAGLSLPPPSYELGGNTDLPKEQKSTSPETKTVPRVVQSPLNNVLTPPITDTPSSISTLPVNDDQVQVSSSSPAIADDADLIEKEWVMKAKQIVDKNKEDPYEQNKEMSRFKADYIKKRYNRDVKVAE